MRLLIAIVLLGSLAGGAAPAMSLGPTDVTLERAWGAIPFAAPLVLASAPGDTEHVYVALQQGLILRVSRDPAADVAETFLDIRDRVRQSGGEAGLLGLAFDPDYPANGRFYVNYVTQGAPRRTVIARFSRAAGASAADPSSELELLGFEQPYGNHNGGWVGIGPDRHLYVSSGDGGSVGDPQNNAQRLDTLLGKVLRITRSGATPANNPFVATAGARGEIWAYGLRNPYRMAFDLVTGELWAGDVGQSSWEEIDLIRRGRNYGWRVYEGSHPYDNPEDIPPEAFTAPVHEYTRDEGCSVIGGAVYRGGAIPALAGRFVYTDYCSGTLWALKAQNGVLQENTVIGQVPGNPTGIGEDPDGELYVTTLGGEIWRVAPGSGAGDAEFPPLLSQAGLFADTAALAPAPDLVPFAVRVPFWSDRADKQRWFRLPAGRGMRFRTLSAWTLPVGSATVKHFDIELADGSVRRLETRVFRRLREGWRGATYRWNAAQTDAELVRVKATEVLQVRLGSGRVVDQTWEYPSPAGCLRCHSDATRNVLGLNTPQLNRWPIGGGQNQLAAFAQAGLFTTDIGDPAQYAALTRPGDVAAPLELRARAYLQVNCAQCHRPGGPTGVDMDLRWTRSMAQTRTVGVLPTGDDLGIEGALRIAPGEPERSLVWQRMRRLDAHRMPPLGSHVINAGGVRLVGDWIEAGAN